MIRYWLALIIWGLGSVFVYWKSGGDWQAVAAIATWFLALGVTFAFLQVLQARRSTNAQLAVELFRELRGLYFKKTLRDIIYKNKREAIKDFPKDENKSKELDRIESVIDWFDMLGALVHKGIVDKELAIEAFAGPPALRCWYQLVPYIRETQSSRGFYGENYEDFARRTLEHFSNARIEIWLRLDWEKDRIPLVKELTELLKKKDKLRPRSLKEAKTEFKEEQEKYN